MPETAISADATLLSAPGFDRSAIMRRAVQLARMFREDAARAWRNRHSGALQHGGKVPALVLPSWRRCMSEALTIAWREARTERAMTPAVREEIAAVEIAALTIQCGERPSRAELVHLPALQARAAELRSHYHT